MELKDNHFYRFTKDLSDLGLQRVNVEESTWIGKDGTEKVEDYIFIPKSYTVLQAGVRDNRGISDHNLVYARIMTRK